MIKSVIFVTGSLADGGAEKVMSILASGCAELGADVTLVVLRPKKIVYPVSDKVKIVQFTDDGKLATIYPPDERCAAEENQVHCGEGPLALWSQLSGSRILYRNGVPIFGDSIDCCYR